MNARPFEPLPVVEADPLEQRLQRLADETVNAHGLPGVQLGVRLADGRQVVVASGTRDLARREPRVSPADALRVGSTTKLFVAVLFARLQEQGRLGLDDAVGRWVPELPQVAALTPRRLLGHTSGLSEHLFSRPTLLARAFLFPHTVFAPLEVLAATLEALEAPADDGRFRYANDNFVLLGLVAQRATGQTAGALLHTEVLAPLGLESTWLLPTGSGPPPSLLPGYDSYIPLGPHRIAPDTTSWDSLASTAGGLASTAGDLLRFLWALFHGQALQPATYERLLPTTDARGNGRDADLVAYGLGLARTELGAEVLLGHPGAGLGGDCQAYWSPARDVAVVVLINASRPGDVTGKALVRAVLSCLD